MGLRNHPPPVYLDPIENILKESNVQEHLISEKASKQPFSLTLASYKLTKATDMTQGSMPI